MGHPLLLLAAMLLTLPGIAQTAILSGQVLDSQMGGGLAGAMVLLRQDTTVFTGCSTAQDGSFQLQKPRSGEYTLEVIAIGYRAKRVQLIGTGDGAAPLRILMPGFCAYAYTRGTIPPCLGGHTDQIVPIAYGLPTARTMEKAKKGKLYLGGCGSTGCDPGYYCLLHKREL
jgi:hypothetical protein